VVSIPSSLQSAIKEEEMSNISDLSKVYPSQSPIPDHASEASFLYEVNASLQQDLNPFSDVEAKNLNTTMPLKKKKKVIHMKKKTSHKRRPSEDT
jgi:hypothetical protein